MNKLVVITGCTRGLGAAMAREFSARDWTVAGCGTKEESCIRLQAELGPDHTVLPCDVTDAGAVEAFANDIINEHGAPDLLINNAAIINRNAPLWELSAEEFSAIVEVNLKGVHHVCRAFLPAMLAKGTGVIVNFSSGWGRSTAAGVASYCATKWGIEGLTRALAEDLPEGMTAVPLNPGIIDTDMLRTTFGEGASQFSAPDEWAKRAVPLLEGLGPEHNGQPMSVDG